MSLVIEPGLERRLYDASTVPKQGFSFMKSKHDVKIMQVSARLKSKNPTEIACRQGATLGDIFYPGVQ